MLLIFLFLHGFSRKRYQNSAIKAHTIITDIISCFQGILEVKLLVVNSKLLQSVSISEYYGVKSGCLSPALQKVENYHNNSESKYYIRK